MIKDTGQERGKESEKREKRGEKKDRQFQHTFASFAMNSGYVRFFQGKPMVLGMHDTIRRDNKYGADRFRIV